MFNVVSQISLKRFINTIKYFSYLFIVLILQCSVNAYASPIEFKIGDIIYLQPTAKSKFIIEKFSSRVGYIKATKKGSLAVVYINLSKELRAAKNKLEQVNRSIKRNRPGTKQFNYLTQQKVHITTAVADLTVTATVVRKQKIPRATPTPSSYSPCANAHVGITLTGLQGSNYVRGSGDIGVGLTGDVSCVASIDFITYSYVEGIMMGYATDALSPYIYDPVALALVPNGDVEFQAYARAADGSFIGAVAVPGSILAPNNGSSSSGSSSSIAPTPTPPPSPTATATRTSTPTATSTPTMTACANPQISGSFSLSSGQYIIGSGDIPFQITGDTGCISGVIFQAWSTVAGAIQGAFTDISAPYAYPGSSLALITPGSAYLQAIVRFSNGSSSNVFSTSVTIVINSGSSSSGSSSSIAPTPTATATPTRTPTPITSSSSSSSSSSSVAGWSDFPLAADARVIYVDNSIPCSDSNVGTAQSAPKCSIAGGYAALRDGYPDHLRLKRGDTFSEGSIWLDKSGRSHAEPSVIEAYGDEALARPVWNTGVESGFLRSSRVHQQHIAIMNLEIHGDGSGNGNGIGLIGGGTGRASEDLLFEDLYIHGYGFNFVVQGGDNLETESHRDITIRRSIIADAPGGGHSSGLFTAGVAGQLLLEENFFDHNGWTEGVAGLEPNHFNHNIYIYGYEGSDYATQLTTLRGNIIARASHSGAQMRGGGVAYDNLFIANPASLQFGTKGLQGGNGFDPTVPMHVDGQYNVITESVDGPDAFGSGILLDWIIGGGTIAHNLVANSQASQPFWIDFEAANAQPAPTQNVDVHDNTVYRGGRAEFEGDSSKLFNIQFRNNTLQNTDPARDLVLHYQSPILGQIISANNRFYSTGSAPFYYLGAHNFSSWKSAVGDTTSVMQSVAFPNSSAKIGDYNAFVGGVNARDAFLARARLQRRGNWSATYTAASANAWLRSQFGM